MKFLQYILICLLPLAVVSSCVKNEWEDVSRPTLWTPDRYVESLDMDFNSVSMTDGQYLSLPAGWLNVGANGTHRAFQTSIMGSNYQNSESPGVRSTQATAYLALGNVDAWLVTPPLKAAGAANATFSYSLYSAYQGSSTFQVLCYSTHSSKKTVPPLNEASWKLIEGYNPTGYTSSFVSKQFNLSTQLNAGDDVLYVAFRYSKQYGSDANTWYVDDIKYNK